MRRCCSDFVAEHASGIGPELTSRDVRDVVAIGRKADVTRKSLEDRC
jgi:hypothetical protein